MMRAMRQTNPPIWALLLFKEHFRRKASSVGNLPRLLSGAVGRIASGRPIARRIAPYSDVPRNCSARRSHAAQ